LIGQRQKVTCIVYRILHHLLGERTPSPIRLLRPFCKFDAEETLHHRRQAKFANAEQSRSDYCVENPGRREVQTAAKQSKIIIRAVQNNFLLRKSCAQRRKIQVRQRIDNIISPDFVVAVVADRGRHADLEQTKFLPITMQAVGFGIDRHAIHRLNLHKQLGEA
jgi:hypothetical protein